MVLKLGILGLSEGNGHPYSWSAIFNGYDPKVMAECPFPVIPDYLSREKFPESAIREGQVTHIWTQDRAISEHVARASLIPTIVDEYTDMVTLVEAALLARDDAEHHEEMARPFLQAGLPVYIDKPIALNLDSLRRIFELEKYPGQLFTCSALRFAKELTLSAADRGALGRIKSIEAQTPKDWAKYSMHLIDPVLQMLPPGDEPVECRRSKAGDTTTLEVVWNSGIVGRFSSLGQKPSPISIRVFGEYGEKLLSFTDTYSAFKGALKAFMDTVSGSRTPDSRAYTEQAVRLVEAGCG